MPANNSTGTTIKASSLSLLSAINTDFRSSFWNEAFIMFYTVTINAISNAIFNIKSQFWILGKWFYVMSMKFFFVSTFLADIIISFKNRLSPFFQLIRKTSSFSKHRFSIFESIASSSLARTRTRTKPLIPLISFKRFFAEFANFNIRRISFLPTISTTVFRIFSSIRKSFIFLFANNANFINHSKILTEITYQIK